VVFARTDTDATIASFDCEISNLTRYVSPKVGDVQVVIPIPNAEVGADAHRIFGGVGYMSMYVYRDEDVWWGGFLDEIVVDSSGDYPVITASGATFEAYPDRREARTDETLTQIEQTEIAKWLWDYMQKSPGGNIRVDVPTPPASGVKRDMSWKRSDIKTVGSILKEVSNRADGFEWMIECYADDSGMRRRQLVTGYPVIGRPSNGTILTFPGDVISYRIEDMALDGAVSFQARGKAPDPIGTPNPSGGAGAPSEKQDPIMSSVITNDALIQAGYTLTDTTIDRPTVTEVSTLDDWALLARDLRSGPMLLPDVTCRMDNFNQSILGSVVNLKINDYLWPQGPWGEPGFQISARVIGYEVDPGEYGADDIVKLLFENPRDADNLKRSPD
jgi:hypothetical protein